MVEILGSPKDVVAFRVTETLDADDYQEIIEEIEFRLVTHQKVSIYADLLDLNHVTAQAVAKRIAYSIAKIGEWHRFPRVALLTEKSWMAAMSKISSALIPRVQIKTFDRSAKDEALRWTYAVTSPKEESVQLSSHSVTN